MRLQSLREIIASVAKVGRGRRPPTGPATARDLGALCRRLLELKGEASVISAADGILTAYRGLDGDGRRAFFRLLLADFAPDAGRIGAAIDAWQAEPNAINAMRLGDAAEAPRQELVRLLNTAPEGTAALVAMRADLLAAVAEEPALAVVDHDLAHLLRAWFNRGFLELRRIDWRTPAFILEKLIAYEAVHEIQGWGDLRRRLAADRRCYAFFHPALPDEPLIFVQVALVQGLADSIQAVLDAAAPTAEVSADTAIFYSISNCQQGLAGISFGNFLIKQVGDSLAEDVPGLATFSTLSPIPGFVHWLREAHDRGSLPALDEAAANLLPRVLDADWVDEPELVGRLQPLLLHLCAHYLVVEKRRGEPRDAVARFHLRNGARLERLNWLGDRSAKGLAESAGLLVNYLYDRKQVAANHEAYVNEGRVVTAAAVAALAGQGRRGTRRVR